MLLNCLFSASLRYLFPSLLCPGAPLSPFHGGLFLLFLCALPVPISVTSLINLFPASSTTIATCHPEPSGPTFFRAAFWRVGPRSRRIPLPLSPAIEHVLKLSVTSRSLYDLCGNPFSSLSLSLAPSVMILSFPCLLPHLSHLQKPVILSAAPLFSRCAAKDLNSSPTQLLPTSAGSPSFSQHRRPIPHHRFSHHRNRRKPLPHERIMKFQQQLLRSHLPFVNLPAASISAISPVCNTDTSVRRPSLCLNFRDLRRLVSFLHEKFLCLLKTHFPRIISMPTHNCASRSNASCSCPNECVSPLEHLSLRSRCPCPCSSIICSQ